MDPIRNHRVAPPASRAIPGISTRTRRVRASSPPPIVETRHDDHQNQAAHRHSHLVQEVGKTARTLEHAHYRSGGIDHHHPKGKQKDGAKPHHMLRPKLSGWVLSRPRIRPTCPHST